MVAGLEGQRGVPERQQVDDREQFLTLFLQHEADLRAFIAALVRDRHVREDLFQEVALVLWRQFPTYQAERSFGAWARGIAANKILQRRSVDARFPLALAPEAIDAVLAAYQRTEEKTNRWTEALHYCLERLSQSARQFLALRYRDELKPAEIAQRTGRTLDAVYQTLSRLRAKLDACIRRRLTADG
jgi:RNA polymerase sigma-70 factor (ECF subfamily)